MQEFRPEIQQAYAYDRESVHFEIEPIGRAPLPRHECKICHGTFSQDQFGQVAPHRKASNRVSRQRYMRALHPHCFKCRKQARENLIKHSLYSAELDHFVTQIVRKAKAGAVLRGILFALDKDDVLGMYLAQGGMCAMTGLAMNWRIVGRREQRNYQAPSLDRIDSAGNYVLGNVHVVMMIVNVMKNDLPIDSFVGLCRQIAAHNISL